MRTNEGSASISALSPIDGAMPHCVSLGLPEVDIVFPSRAAGAYWVDRQRTTGRCRQGRAGQTKPQLPLSPTWFCTPTPFWTSSCFNAAAELNDPRSPTKGERLDTSQRGHGVERLPHDASFPRFTVPSEVESGSLD